MTSTTKNKQMIKMKKQLTVVSELAYNLSGLKYPFRSMKVSANKVYKVRSKIPTR